MNGKNNKFYQVNNNAQNRLPRPASSGNVLSTVNNNNNATRQPSNGVPPGANKFPRNASAGNLNVNCPQQIANQFLRNTANTTASSMAFSKADAVPGPSRVPNNNPNTDPFENDDDDEMYYHFASQVVTALFRIVPDF
jgi:hypothetical protein